MNHIAYEYARYLRAISNTLGIEWENGHPFPYIQVLEKLDEFRKAEKQLFICPDCGYKVNYSEFINQDFSL